MTSTIAPAVPDAPDGRWIEYAGGYSDMLVQRKGAIDERKRAAERAAEVEDARQDAVFRGTKGKGQTLLQAEIRVR